MTNRIKLPLIAILLGSVLSACALTGPPPNLDLSLAKASDDGKYLVAITPPAATVAVNQLHSWNIAVRNVSGEAVTGATIRFDGGMPQHMHGYPTKPRITEAGPAGAYRLDGVKMSMTGWWEIKLQIQGPGGADRVTFNTVLTDAGLAKTAGAIQ